MNKLDGARFLFIVEVTEKAQKKAQFSFCGQRKAFHYEIAYRGIQPYFLHCGERLACFECKQGSDVLENFEENYKMCPDWRWRDFVLKFAVCSADFLILA